MKAPQFMLGEGFVLLLFFPFLKTAQNVSLCILNKLHERKGKKRIYFRCKMEYTSNAAYSPFLWGFPGGSDGKVSACNAGDLGSIPGSGRFPWRRKWRPTPVFLPGEFHERRSLEGYSPWGCKESGTTEQLRFLSCFLRVTKFLLTLK